MSDRLKGVVVTFDADYRTDDAESIISAIRMVRGVADVAPSLTDFNDQMNRARVADALSEKVYAFWKDLRDTKI